MKSAQLNIPMTNLPRVVIVGAGFAGINLAKGLDSSKMQVILLNKTNYHSFQPLLYQVATAGLEPDSIAHSVRSIFKKENHFYFRIANVEKIDAEQNMLTTDLGTISYDHLVIATGSETNYYGNANIQKYAMAMKTVPEAINMRSLIIQNLEAALLTNNLEERNSLMNFVIVGGGPTGVELAGAFAELKRHVLPTDYPDLDIRRMNVHLIQAMPSLLIGMSEKSGEKARKYLENMGVTIWFDTIVNDYDGLNVKTNNQDFQTRTLIWTAGVKGAIIEGLPQESQAGGRFLVNEYSEVKGFTNIYAIGDIACMVTEKYPKGHPMVAQPAIQQGKLLAKNITRKLKNKPLLPFKYWDKGSMATVGRNKAVVDIGKMRFSGWFAWVLWMFIHLAFLVGFRNKIVALVNWIIQYFQYNKGVRLIIRPYQSEYEKEQSQKNN
ncbi:MAG: NAD(P)/FAD-dependent oxidoreductase [Capnocytophaga sp.]|nr:NAD(P)/FAD-dependent oxidoreductase [Capnocytophaga sp.]